LDCFGLFWISVLNVQSEGKVYFKEGKGRSQLLYQLSLGHGNLFWALNPSSKTPSKTPSKKFLFGSVSVRPMSHTVICLLSCRNVRSPSLGLKSESISRLFTVRGRVLRLSIKSLSYESLPPLHSCVCNFITVFGWLLGNFGSGSRKVRNTTPSPIYFFLYRILF